MSSGFDPEQHPHRRLNPLTGEHVLVSPQRTRRPWQGKSADDHSTSSEPYSPTCYLCPGNERAGNQQNPDYSTTFVFTNDFAALLPDVPEKAPAVGDLFQSESVRGTSRVICFSPRHDLTLARMEPSRLLDVVDTWTDQERELGREYRWVQIFESKGQIVGASNPHPHGQVWASDFLPSLAAREDERQLAYHRANGRPLLLDYLAAELERGERIVAENEHWVALVPFWAYWPFELLLLPRRHRLRLVDLQLEERQSLAMILKSMLTRYDNLFRTAFPYCSGWHAAPHGPDDWRHWQLHAHYYPPLLRSASVQKFVASYEWLAEAQRDLTAERAAALLREQSEAHYLEGEE